VSLSGDKTMRVWDYKKGVQLQLLELDYVGMSISSVEINSNYVAIKSEKNCIYIYEYQFDEKNHLTLNLLISKEYSGYTEVLSKGPDFLIATSNDKSQISLEKISLSQENFEFEFVCNVNDTTKMEISSRNPDISFLFNNKFENQDEYLDRKRKKIK
jgi:WD40 repeat protein